MTFGQPPTYKSLRVPAKTANLAEARDFVGRAASDAGLAPERIFDLKVATSEAFANAVEHACASAEHLEVCVRLFSKRIVVEISDDGCFRPPKLPARTSSNRGLGLPLMVALMDEVSFAKTPGGGTTVRLAVALGQ